MFNKEAQNKNKIDKHLEKAAPTPPKRVRPKTGSGGAPVKPRKKKKIIRRGNSFSDR